MKILITTLFLILLYNHSITLASIPPATASNGRVVTVLLHGTSNDRNGDRTKFPNGELIQLITNNLKCQGLLENFHYIVAAGPGEKFNKNVGHYWGKRHNYDANIGGMTGLGVEDSMDHVMHVLDGKPTTIDGTNYLTVMKYKHSHPDEQLIKKIVLVGYSRGAVEAFMLANKMNKTMPNIPLDIVAIDPVPGPEVFWKDKEQYSLPTNVKSAQVLYTRNETSAFFEAIIPEVAACNNLITSCNNHNFTAALVPGHHMTVVGTRSYRKGKLDDDIINSLVYADDVIDLVRLVTYRYLINHNVYLTDDFISLDEAAILKKIAAITSSDAEVFFKKIGDKYKFINPLPGLLPQRAALLPQNYKSGMFNPALQPFFPDGIYSFINLVQEKSAS